VITDLPIAFTGLCLLLAVLYAGALYYREKRHEIPEWLRWILALSRGIVVFLISFLLLSPLFKQLIRNTEPPLLVLAQDNSGSLVFQKDSTFMRDEYPQMLDEFKESLGDKFSVVSYTFGNDFERLQPGEEFAGQLTYNNKRTNIAALVREIRDLYENRNLGAVIIGSDGINNTGMNPLYTLSQTTYPFYAIALGDTALQRDVVISNVRYNRVSYLNNKFPVEVTVTANRYNGSAARMVITRGDSTVASRNFTIDGSVWAESFRFLLEAKETGLQRYRIRVLPLQEEISTANNEKSIYVEVLDVRSKVLILANSPHPDVSALKEGIRSNINYEVEDLLINDLDKPLEAYSLVILHQLPSTKNSIETILGELTEKEIPYLVVVGEQTNIPRLNAMATGLQLTASGSELQEALPVADQGFTLFTLSDELLNTMGQLPPLIVPFGTYETGNAVETFLNQRIGTINTSRPLIFFSNDLDKKWGVVMGTGIWKWRIYSYAENGTHGAFNELVTKMVQYLSLREDRSRFRIVHERSFFDNEPVIFDAELYNESYELVNEPEVELEIKDENGNVFPFTMLKKGDSYTLNAGQFEPGRYTFTGSVVLFDDALSASGTFIVNELNIEMLNSTADHNLLFSIAERTGGSMVPPGQLEALADKLLASEELKPVVYVQNKFVPLIDLPWILALVFVLLALEWFARRRQGAY
jgi:hypothetical protein